jgi:hypothetical protein
MRGVRLRETLFKGTCGRGTVGVQTKSRPAHISERVQDQE